MWICLVFSEFTSQHDAPQKRKTFSTKLPFISLHVRYPSAARESPSQESAESWGRTSSQWCRATLWNTCGSPNRLLPETWIFAFAFKRFYSEFRWENEVSPKDDLRCQLFSQDFHASTRTYEGCERKRANQSMPYSVIPKASNDKRFSLAMARRRSPALRKLSHPLGCSGYCAATNDTIE